MEINIRCNNNKKLKNKRLMYEILEKSIEKNSEK